MPLIADSVFDAGLATVQSGGTRIDICSSEPTSYATIARVTLGNKTGLTTGAPANGAVNGRRVTVPAITIGRTGQCHGDGHCHPLGAEQRQFDALRCRGADEQSGGDGRAIRSPSTPIDVTIADAT